MALSIKRWILYVDRIRDDGELNLNSECFAQLQYYPPYPSFRNDLTLEDSSTAIAATLRVPMTRGQLAREAAIFLKESYEWER